MLSRWYQKPVTLPICLAGNEWERSESNRQPSGFQPDATSICASIPLRATHRECSAATTNTMLSHLRLPLRSKLSRNRKPARECMPDLVLDSEQ